MLNINESQAPKSIQLIDTSGMIFVFGSNEAGRHGAGAAGYAHQRKGAILGKGVGRMNDSWAIPTKDIGLRTLPRTKIREYVDMFLTYARSNPQTRFQVTAIGCGLAGYRNSEIAPMFIGAPANCYFDTVWREWLPEDAKFWGTF